MESREQAMQQKFNKIMIMLFSGFGIAALILLLVILIVYLLHKPVMANFYYRQAASYCEDGFVYEAREAIDKLMELDSKGEAAKKATVLTKYYLPKAEDISKKALTLNRKGVDNSCCQNTFDEAIEYFNLAIEESPDFEWPYNNLAMVIYRKDKDYQEALKLLDDALKLNPDYIYARIGLGTIYFAQARELFQEKKYAEALLLMEKSQKEFEKSSEIESDNKSLNSEISDLKEYINLTKKKLKEIKPVN